MVAVGAEQVRGAARKRLVAASFVDFLRFARIQPDESWEGEIGADGAIPWQPWPHLLERARAWEGGASEYVLKARQEGLSWLLVMYGLWMSGYHSGKNTALFSKGQLEARALLRKGKFVWDRLPEDIKPAGEFKVDQAEFADDTFIQAFPSTEDAGISFTFALVIADEQAFHPYAAANYAAYAPTISAGGQHLGVSTADPKLGPAGFFYDMYWDSKAGKTPYSAVFIPWDARPGRGAEWMAAQRLAYSAAPDGTLEAYFPATDTDAFIARSGLVYPMFSRARHLKEDPCKWEDYKYRVAGVDFGGGDPTAVVPIGVTAQEHVHQPEEWYQRGPVGADEIGAYLWTLHRRAPFWAILCDPSEPAAIKTLRNLGLPAYPADNRRAEGLGAVKFFLDNDRLSLNPRACPESVGEFFTYRWRESTDPSSRQKYQTSSPVQNHSDAQDARRYAILALLKGLQRRTSGTVKMTVA